MSARRGIKGVIFGLAVSFAAFGAVNAVAAEQAVYDHYRDWSLSQVEVASKENGDDELNEAGNSLDLMLCGHEHYYARNDAHSTEIHHNFKYDSDRQKAKPPQFKYLSDKWNFTEVCGGLGEGACLEIKGRELTFTSFDWKQPGQPPLDKFTLKK